MRPLSIVELVAMGHAILDLCVWWLWIGDMESIMTGYIHDGQTLRFFIKPLPGVHDGLRGEYRPVLSRDRAVIVKRNGELFARDAGQAQDFMAKTVAGQIVSWDFSDGKTVLPVTAEVMARMHPLLFTRLRDIVIAYGPEDVSDPDESFDEETSAKNLLVESG